MEFSLADELIAALEVAGLMSSAQVRQDADFRTIVWKSANPAVKEDLELKLSLDPGLFWFGGYMYDFPDIVHGTDEMVIVRVVEFIESFFNEEILCGWSTQGGGPICITQPVWPEGSGWFCRVGQEIRSWKGTHDATVSEETALPWLRKIRPLRAEEVPEVAAFYIDIQADTVPTIHPLHEVIDYITNVRVANGSSYVFEQYGKILGWLDVADGWVNHLYVRRGETGKGIGTELLTYTKFKSPKGLQLWTFQVNEGARRFYAREGFHEVELTEGQNNEERKPDVRLTWKV